jgi:flagellar biosynthesis chaperone FliJ
VSTPQVLAIGAQHPWSAELGEPVFPQRQAVYSNPPLHQEDIAAVLMAGERIPLRIPASYCEELFAKCASEDESNLLRSVYFREAAASGRDYILDQGLVTPGDLTQRSSRIQQALRAAALAAHGSGAVSQQQKAHPSAPPANVEDPATKRKLLQQEHVIALQNRKIQELEARASRIKQVGHSFVEQPATAVELQEAQARLSVLKVHTDQQAEDIKKLESEVESAVQQLEQGEKLHRAVFARYSTRYKETQGGQQERMSRKRMLHDTIGGSIRLGSIELGQPEDEQE